MQLQIFVYENAFPRKAVLPLKTERKARLMIQSRYSELIQFALKNEREASKLYQKYAAIVTSNTTKKLLLEMAAMEREHEKILKNFSHKVPASSGSSPMDDVHVADFFVQIQINENSTVQDVFTFAIQAEQKAIELYSQLSNLESDSTVKKMFSDLAVQEKGHKNGLEKEYEQVFLKDF